jgi:uncharacterized protein (DUF1501 family)
MASSDCNHCRDFSRAQLLRGGAAAAGSGLPSIEMGMPDPAGTGLSRRSFLARSAGLALTVFGAGSLAPAQFEEGIEAAMAATGDGRVLVSIYLAGGLDGLSVLSPATDNRYRALRPRIAVPVSSDPLNVFSQDSRLQWHPSAAGFRELHRENKMTVLPAIGYLPADGSHFTSRHYWEVGELNPRNIYGWMGRYLDRYGASDNPLQGLTIGYSLQPSLAPASVPVATIADPTVYNFWIEHVGSASMIDEGVQTLARIGAANAGDDAETAGARTALRQLSALKGQLGPMQGATRPFQNTVEYPSTGKPFPDRLATVAEMIGRGLPLRCVALQTDAGYDNHAGLHATFGGAFKQDVDTIVAFQRDLEARGIADRVLTHVWTEFGRRVPENGPDGCDHGAGGISFLIGTKVKGEMIGEFPGLGVLDAHDNLRATTDFRALYCSLLEQWFGADAGPVIPGADSYARMPLVAA